MWARMLRGQEEVVLNGQGQGMRRQPPGVWRAEQVLPRGKDVEEVPGSGQWGWLPLLDG